MLAVILVQYGRSGSSLHGLFLFLIFLTLNAMLPYSSCQTEARLPLRTCREVRAYYEENLSLWLNIPLECQDIRPIH